MEVKINKEIREYTESVFLGLSMRQAFFSVLACVLTLVSYFVLQPALGTEITSWVCILVALPCAVLGFVTYNGMTAEQLVIAWVRSEILMPKRLVFQNENIYANILKKGRRELKHD